MLGKPILPLTLAALGYAGLLAGLAPGSARGQEMQVEEPETPAAPPIDPAQDAGSWQVRQSSSALSPAQRAALEERRKQVEAMTREIREKREALENSGQAEKAVRVKELESLILESGGGAQILERMEKVLEKQSMAQEKNLTKKAEQLEKKLEKIIEKNQDKLNNSDKNQKPKDPKPGK